MRLRAGVPVGQMNDELLITRVARGDSEALEALYDEHASTVLAIALKVVGDRSAAEDVLQETFWRVWKSASTYRQERGAVSAWLFRIARNLAIDAFRRGGVRPQILEMEQNDSFLEWTPDSGADVADQAHSSLLNQQVRAALSRLPNDQKKVIELAYFYGMTRQEIAEATGEPLGTIHTRARLGLQKLRDELAMIEFEG